MRQAPRSILTFKPVTTGLSGGVTAAGTLAEFSGAAWIAGVAVLVGRGTTQLVAAIFIAGVLGALVDSVLGATVQELRRCPRCERLCETNPHECGAQTERVRGVRGFGNDAVNFAATLTGAAVGFTIAALSGR